MRNPFIAALLTAAAVTACGPDTPADAISGPATAVRVFTSLEMTPSAFTLTPIQPLSSRGLWVRARDQYGMDMDGGVKSFSSSDPSVATVTSHGGSVGAVVTAVAPGEAEISASWTLGGVTKTAKSRVTVESTEGWSLKLDPLTLNVDSMHMVQATVLDERGNPRIQTAVDAFTSDRDDVVALIEACIDWWGCFVYVRGVAPGEATITAEYGGLSGTTSVTVVP